MPGLASYRWSRWRLGAEAAGPTLPPVEGTEALRCSPGDRLSWSTVAEAQGALAA